jgi:hypothetical protein
MLEFPGSGSLEGRAQWPYGIGITVRRIAWDVRA